MSTPLVVSVTDELAAELEELARKVGAMALDSAEEVVTQSGRMIECPACCGEGYASAENDYCNFDNHAIGVEFYGIGPEFGLAEAYFRKASPATILALLAERAELLRDAERLDWFIKECCVMECMNGSASPVVYRIYWSHEAEGQREWYASPRAAIDSAMQSEAKQ